MKDRPILYLQDNRRPAKEYTRADVFDHHPCADRMYVGGDRNNWTAWYRTYQLTVVGNNIFWKETGVDSCTFKDGKLYGNFERFHGVLREVFKLDWIKEPWVIRALGNRKDLWKRVLLGKITNPEMLAKYISKRYFKGVYSYRSLKEYYNNQRGSLWNLYYYTTNPEESLRRLNSGAEFDEWYQLFNDALRYAEILNEKINPMWSVKRLAAEHQCQIERRNIQRLGSIPDVNIANALHLEGLSMIRNAKECYIEGCSMHNCIYTNYWPQVIRGGYLLFKGCINDENIHLGLWYSGGCFTFDQVHTIYNGYADEKTINFCHEWLVRHQERLLKVRKEILSVE